MTPELLNADGTPKILYHGTDYRFTIFKKRGSYEEYFFTDSIAAARDYGEVQMKVYLSMKNPYVVDLHADGDAAIYDAIDYSGMVSDGLKAEGDGVSAADYCAYLAAVAGVNGKDLSTIGVTGEQYESSNGLAEIRKLEVLESMELDEAEERALFERVVASDSRAEDIAEYVEAGLSWEEIKDAIKNNVAGKESYEKLLGLGVSTQSATLIYDAISELEPEEGSKSVSDWQKAKAVAELNLQKTETVKVLGEYLKENANAYPL